MVPINKDANKPCAIALNASIPYRFQEKITFFFFKNSFIVPPVLSHDFTDNNTNKKKVKNIFTSDC